MQWSTLRQGGKIVADYIQEWERLSVLCDVNELEEMRVGRRFKGKAGDVAAFNL